MRVTLDRAIVLRQPWAQAVVEGALPALIRRLSTNVQGHVGVLAAKNRDSAGYAAPEADCPLGAIVGAVELEHCIELDEAPRRFLRKQFGHKIARFYPEHFLPDGGEIYAWILSEAIPAERSRGWEGPTPRIWAQCNTWIEGEPIQLVEKAEGAQRLPEGATPS